MRLHLSLKRFVELLQLLLATYKLSGAERRVDPFRLGQLLLQLIKLLIVVSDLQLKISELLLNLSRVRQT